ncbi:aromatic ring-hydroxylating dioxygenase subunit alpha [Amycolatopsis sp. H6(2020)]|nr:aromatic ring-hydroxylating dioxygenase subunit alpha [Amycolatopsis sp. H6(2020)]
MDQRERRFLENAWFPVATVDDLDGGIVPGRILDTDLAVARVGGEITVTQDDCPHRGMAMSRGRVVDGLLECPYHGWLFDGRSGSCVKIPSLPEGAEPVRAALKVYPARVAYGLVWSSLRASPQSETFFPRLLEELGGRWHIATGRPYRVSCGMRQITENFRDRAHLPFVHWKTMGHTSREVPPYRVEKKGRSLSYRTGVQLMPGQADGAAGQHEMEYFVSLPSAACVAIGSPFGGRRIVLQVATPVDAAGEHVRQFWAVGMDDDLIERGLELDELLAVEGAIFEEDHAVLERQVPAEAPLDLHAQAHTRADRFSIEYRRAYQEMLTGYAAGAGADPLRQAELQVVRPNNAKGAE